MFQDSLLHPRPAWLIAAFALIARHEMLSAFQLAARLDLPPVDVTAPLDALALEGLLLRLAPPPNLRGDPVPVAYALTRRGAELLGDATDAEPATIPSPRRSLFPLAHDLARNSFALVLERLHELGRLRLLRWETARTKIADVTHLAERGRPLRVPLVADGLAVVEVGGYATGLLLEQDQGTVPVERMCRKFRGYDAWWREGGPVRRFGLRSFRVITVTSTTTRLARLREAALVATENRGSRLLWFALGADVTVDDPGRLLAPVWQVAGHDDLHHPLFEQLMPRTVA
ncbi:MAG: hypothetical protein JWM10_741 [Myxococcaceae bacterium]|nr:hypothetical protein [Myxococcaceae bacterium]